MFLNIGIAMESPLHRQVLFKAYCHMGLAFITCQLIQNGFDRWAGMVSLPKLNTLYVWLVPEAPSLDQIFRRSGTPVDHALDTGAYCDPVKGFRFQLGETVGVLIGPHLDAIQGLLDYAFILHLLDDRGPGVLAFGRGVTDPIPFLVQVLEVPLPYLAFQAISLVG